MKVTALTAQQKDPNRVNIMVDGIYRCSLELAQVVDLSVKVGREYTETELVELEAESEFGKLYERALEYCFLRPHSSREIRDYLYRKTRPTKVKSRKTGELYERPGVSKTLTDRVFDRLLEKGYVDDKKFTQFWIDNRNLKKGVSRRKLQAELRAKGVESDTIEHSLSDSSRTDEQELQKIIAKKRARYADAQKFTQYLMRQGFDYDEIKVALQSEDQS